MLYQPSTDEKKINLFIRFLKLFIAGDDVYKSLISEVVDEAQELSIGNKNHYMIDRVNYPIIVGLVKNNQRFLAKLNTKMLTSQDNEHILNSLVLYRNSFAQTLQRQPLLNLQLATHQPRQ
jgi:hypothetical protein